MTGLQLLTPPAIEPISWLDAKAHLRLDSDDERTLVESYISAARQLVEQHTGRSLIHQQWRMVLDTWPKKPRYGVYTETGCQILPAYQTSSHKILSLPKAPLVSIEAVRVYTTEDSAETLDPSLYTLDHATVPGRLIVNQNTVLPTTQRPAAGIEIDFTAGYGATAEAVPESLKHAILLLSASWFENRTDQQAAAELPSPLQPLLQPYKVYSF